MTQLPTYEELHKHLEYDPESGKFSRKKNGSSADTDMNTGYKRVRVTIGGTNYEFLSHRLAWFMSHRVWPSDEIDHINGQKDDNRMGNLRAVNRTQNAKNLKRRVDNTSGITGVHRHQRGWKVSISRTYIGYFKCFGEAIKARKKAEIDYEYHANHGRS